MSRFIRVRMVMPLYVAALFVLAGVASTLYAQSLPPTPALAREHGPIADLEHDLTDIFNDPKFSNATWGVEIQSMQTGEYLFHLNDTKSLLPASNFKLFTAAEALAFLGPEFRYSTQLVTTGSISNGTLRGDLIIRGSGDPTLGSQMIYPDTSRAEVFEAWADSLALRGIKRIDGSIIGDDSYFTSDLYPDGWAIEDMPYYYAMQSSGLAYNENQVTVSVTPGSTRGTPVRYELSPSTDYVTVDNHGVTKQDSITIARRHRPDSVVAPGTTQIDISRDMGTNTITIKGEMPQSGTVTTQQVSVENPTLYAASVLREALESHGIEVRGVTKTSRELRKPYNFLKSRVLATYTSPPMSDIVQWMNKTSDNLFSEQLFRTVAKEIGGEGSWAAGIEIMKRYLTQMGSDTTRSAIYDGSGLSRMDLITPQQMVTLLRTMREEPRLFYPFNESLPVMGVDGTLTTRMRGTAAEGNVRAKTGFVTGVRSISGYLRTRDDELLAFSILGNNFTVPVREANNLQDLVLLRLVNFSRK